MAATYAVVLPARTPRPLVVRQQYFRRRLLVAGCAVALGVATVAGAGTVAANRGGAPASASAVRPVLYIVQPGDTLWSIAESYHGQISVERFVEALIAANDGTDLLPGQQLALPTTGG